jgi:acyl-coenzyme A synthetase/AMP-(fatty) acid ligase
MADPSNARDAPIPSLWDALTSADSGGNAVFDAADGSVELGALAEASILDGALETLRGKSLLLATREQFATALALLELDGVARRVVLCTPDLKPDQLAEVAVTSEAEFVVTGPNAGGDAGEALSFRAPGLAIVRLAAKPTPQKLERRAGMRTEWILLTSGTTGNPKLVLHTLDTLGGTLPRRPAAAARTVWSTFYDIRRYGGLQIYLRALLSGSSLVLSSSYECVADFLARAGAAGVTHISGTPSHWRRALMSGSAARIDPEYVRLSGEIADQAVLDSLKAAYPRARVGHAFASTEAGVAFDVNDGLAGFPARFVDDGVAGIDLKVEDGTLRIRSGRIAQRYLGDAAAPLAIVDGYVDTGDMVELVDGRYLFRGRKSGVINVGGLKVHPEEVELILNADPRVALSLVRARRNPITGAVVVADVVLANGAADATGPAELAGLSGDLLAACRRSLPAHKVPSALRFVPSLELTAAGKLVRPGA